MTLTEQWKKGELESGWYYITTSFADEAIREYFDGDEFRTVFTCNVKKVLAPVPSYEEWQKVLNIDFNNEVLRLENAKLKDLLWSCQAYFNNQLNDNWAKSIVIDIDNAIGEKK